MASSILPTPVSSDYAALLLYWMTHKQAGSAAQLKSGVFSVLDAYSLDTRKIFDRGFRRRLQWLSHAQFEQNEVKQTTWRIMPPGLVVLPEIRKTGEAVNPSAADTARSVLIGARTPDFENKIRIAAHKNNVACKKTPLLYAPPRFALQGRPENIAKVAQAVNLSLIENAAYQRLSHIRPASFYLNETVPRERPDYGVWQVADLNTLTWKDEVNVRGDLSGDVGELLGPYPAALVAQPEHGPWQYFVATTKSQFFAVPDAGSALLTMAWASGKTVCGYDAKSACFFGPKDLPLEMARVLCLCSGKTPQRLTDEGTKRFSYPNGRGYENVPPSLAAALLATISPPETKREKIPAENGVFWIQRSAF